MPVAAPFAFRSSFTRWIPKPQCTQRSQTAERWAAQLLSPGSGAGGLMRWCSMTYCKDHDMILSDMVNIYIYVCIIHIHIYIYTYILYIHMLYDYMYICIHLYICTCIYIYTDIDTCYVSWISWVPCGTGDSCLQPQGRASLVLLLDGRWHGCDGFLPRQRLQVPPLKNEHSMVDGLMTVDAIWTVCWWYVDGDACFFLSVFLMGFSVV